MSLTPEQIREVVERTEIVRPPRQPLATFGASTITYYLVTEPAYQDLLPGAPEAVVRTGKVSAQRPQLVTPYYLMNLFRGFEHGQEFARYLLATYGPNAPGLLYTYSHELAETTIVSDPPEVVAQRLADQLDREGAIYATVIRGVDHLWDISLMKFIYDLTTASLGQNVRDLQQHGLLTPERGLPRAVRLRIEEMFAAVARGDLEPHVLKEELDRWGVFDEYEDRFLGLFRRP